MQIGIVKNQKNSKKSRMTTSISSEADNLLWNRQTDKASYRADYLVIITKNRKRKNMQKLKIMKP